jgi:hypothetical protein
MLFVKRSPPEMKNIAAASAIPGKILEIALAARFGYQSSSVDFLHGRRTRLKRPVA